MRTTDNLYKKYADTVRRSRKKLRMVGERLSSGNSISADLPDVSGDVTGEVDTQLTLKALLSPQDYKILVEHYIHRRSLADIAAETGISYAAVRVRIHRIRLRLRDFFDGM